MMFDETTISAIASFIFIVLAFKYCKNSVKTLLTERINNITLKHNEALQIERDSEIILREQQLKFDTLHKKADEMIKTTEFEIAQFKQRAESEITEKINYKTEIVKKKIRDEEENLLKEIRLQGLSIATKTTTSMLNLFNKKSILTKLNYKTLDNLSH